MRGQRLNWKINCFSLQVCAAAWEHLHAVSKKRRRQILKQKHETEEKRRKRASAPSSYKEDGTLKACEHVRVFLERFFSDDEGRCEKLPYTRGQSEIYKKLLPPWLHKERAYEFYKEACKSEECRSGVYLFSSD